MGNSASTRIGKNTSVVDTVFDADMRKQKSFAAKDGETMFPTNVVFVTDPAFKKEDDMTKPGLDSAESRSLTDETESIISSVSDIEVASKFVVKSWDGKTKFSDMIASGLKHLNKNPEQVVMVYESPSSAANDSSFYNGQVFKFHDYPPASPLTRGIIGPCRYSLMSGSSYPSYLRDGKPPAGLMEHWATYVPGFEKPRFVSTISDNDTIYAYLPVESVRNHVNDPHVHYHLAGKDALPLMTKKTTKLLANTKQQRPCVCKTNHSMASKGIFVIRNDEDEEEFNQFLAESGNPPYIITDYVEIDRNVACHFFIHPSGEVTWMGSNENHRKPNGEFSTDSYLLMKDQQRLRDIQLPYVQDAVAYCQSLGFWGFCGIDVLFDKEGNGHLVDLNPRVTGSCPSLMVAQLLQDKYGYEVGLFRRGGDINYYGSPAQLFAEVDEYNKSKDGEMQIIIFSVYESAENHSKINIGVYGNDLDECRTVLNHYAKPSCC